MSSDTGDPTALYATEIYRRRQLLVVELALDLVSLPCRSVSTTVWRATRIYERILPLGDDTPLTSRPTSPYLIKHSISILT